jgi:hypothetical protein
MKDCYCAYTSAWMRAFLLLVFEGKTARDYWVEAIVNRGI